MSSSATWTRDADGNYVDWTKPPYREGAILRLVLTGENPATIPGPVRQQRIIEYYKLVRREMKKRAQAGET